MRQLFTPAIALLVILVVRTAAFEDRASPIAKLPPPTDRKIDFVRDIEPILTRTCVSCHGPEKQRAGLRLDSRVEALMGGNSGPVLLPGDGAKSRLLQAVAGSDPELSMPPKGRAPLGREEVALLRAWIDQGLSWPERGSTVVQTPQHKHWAWNRPKLTPLPQVRDPKTEIRNAIDVFVEAKRQSAQLEGAPEANRATLVRRVHLDLIGLPPSPDELRAALENFSPDWYEQLVDRLLSSPHYGERWGRHWLDAGRYADSDGYEKDTGRPFAWRWRNWVIDALNRNLPYDQFIIEQLAGDLLPSATLEQKIATGFHRNTLTNKEGGVDQEQFRVEAVVDRVNTTARVFMGLTLGCAQCHDHKYDPFSQREYYQLFAFFDSDVEVNLPAPSPQQEQDYQRLKTEHDKQRQALLLLVDEEKKKLPANLDEAEKKKRLAAVQAKVTAHDKTAPQLPQAQTLALGKQRKTHVMIRGDFLRKGVEVQASMPAVLSAAPVAPGSPDRLRLAKWIASPENPLTSRVLVNNVWQKYFGRGLVPTLDDFGTQGERPSHPELLDWLAVEFQRTWDVKALHRLIVTSATYRQSSALRPELLQRDPLNVLLARQNRLRLDAELVRDQALAASGLLTRTVGGPSVRPPQPPGVSELTYAGSARWVESQGPDRYRRGLYIWFQRTSPYPLLMTFDAPDGNVACVRRERTNTPLQALTILNDAVFVECAQALGKRLLDETPKAAPSERIAHAFRLVFGRAPSTAEQTRLVRLHETLYALCAAQPREAEKLLGNYRVQGVPAAEAAAWMALARTVLNLDEAIVRE